MKRKKIVTVIVFILLLVIMRRYEMIFLSHGITHSPDMRFGYSSNDIYSMFHIFGSSGKSIFVQYFLADYVFIIFFTAIQIYILRWAMGTKLEKKKAQLFMVIPYLRGTFDVIENTLFIFLILQLPKEIPAVVAVMSFITQMKFIIYGVWFVEVAAAFVFRLINNRRLVK